MKVYVGALRLLVCLLILAVSACAAPSSTESPSPTGSPLAEPSPMQGEPLPVSSQDPPEPGPGKAAISGVLYTFTGKGPIPGTLFYLTPAGDQSTPPPALMGIREENKDVSGQSDNQGRIVLNNIPPGRYYLAVWAPYNWILAVESDADSTPRLIVLEPNQRVNLGVIYLSWP